MSHSLKGIALKSFFSLLLAMLAAAAFRFPVPFAGLIGPFGDLPSLSLGDRLVASA